MQDFVSEEMGVALLEKSLYDFGGLFEVVHAKLRLRNATGSGKEMLRLRIYEKLQVLVAQGLAWVKKDSKTYSGGRCEEALQDLASPKWPLPRPRVSNAAAP